MPEHLATLEPHLALHEAELADLRAQAEAVRRQLNDPQPDTPDAPPAKEVPRTVLEAQLERLDRSIAIHERLLQLGRDNRLAKILEEVGADRALAREVARDPRRFAIERGLDLPDLLVIEMQVDDRTTTARINHLDDDAPFVLDWTEDGFLPPPEPATPPA